MYKYTFKNDMISAADQKNSYDIAKEYATKYHSGDEPDYYGASVALWRALETAKWFVVYSVTAPEPTGSVLIGGYPFKVEMFNCEEV